MKVILKEDISNLGKKNELVEVADGHARNYLLPKGLAVEANEAEMAKLKEKKKAKQKKQQEELAAAKEKAERLEGATLEISVKAGDQGKLFGSVTTSDIAEVIKDELGIKIDKRIIQLEDHIRSLGTKQVAVNLHKDVSATIKVRVTEA